jgi:hypothetical protein
MHFAVLNKGLLHSAQQLLLLQGACNLQIQGPAAAELS